jgi:hypothetical protein
VVWESAGSRVVRCDTLHFFLSEFNLKDWIQLPERDVRRRGRIVDKHTKFLDGIDVEEDITSKVALEDDRRNPDVRRGSSRRAEGDVELADEAEWFDWF